MDLKAQVKVVAMARGGLSAIREIKKQEHDKWEQEHSELLNGIKEAETFVAEAEETLRQLTLQAYQETGEKTPAPGVGIRETIRLEYNIKDATDWAIRHSLALKLDVPTFEQYAKMEKMDFVEIVPEIKATIATDLSKVIGEE